MNVGCCCDDTETITTPTHWILTDWYITLNHSTNQIEGFDPQFSGFVQMWFARYTFDASQYSAGYTLRLQRNSGSIDTTKTILDAIGTIAGNPPVESQDNYSLIFRRELGKTFPTTFTLEYLPDPLPAHLASIPYPTPISTLSMPAIRRADLDTMTEEYWEYHLPLVAMLNAWRSHFDATGNEGFWWVRPTWSAGAPFNPNYMYEWPGFGDFDASHIVMSQIVQQA